MKGLRIVTLSVVCLILIFMGLSLPTKAQPNSRIELKDKPKRYENRKLRSEKTGDKKLSVVGRVFQNTFTHYNYYFNANTKLNEVIALARSAQKDDFNKLLPYYNYNLDATAAQTSELDSIVYKITSGILLHDLRNDWIDDMYMLLGKAYLHRKIFDSAAYTFQFLNYAYAPKEDGGYDIPIGSNASGTNGVFTVATAEKKSIFKKPSVRNEALLWLSRSYIEADRTGDAMGILEILRRDPNFPKRLKDEWNEVMGFLHYKQKNYDSAAFYVTQTLNIAEDNTDKGRRAFLAAQLYQLANADTKSVEWFNRSAKITNDPVMEVYASLYAIRANQSTADNFLQRKKDELMKLAKRDKYESYRSIIYYVAAQVELERKNSKEAYRLLQQSVKYSNDPTQRNLGFLLLGDLNFDERTYAKSLQFYDSLLLASVTDADDLSRVTVRKPALTTVRNNFDIIRLQDSLQMLASLTEDERNTILKRAVKQQRKQQGISLESDADINRNNSLTGDKGADLFVTSSNTKSDFYFNNTSLKVAGFNDFKSKWGSRPNADNWRRSAAINNVSANDPSTTIGDPALAAAKTNPAMTIDDAYKNLPTTAEALAKSNKMIADALLQNAKTFHYDFHDINSADNSYKQLLSRFPKSDNREEALYNYFQLLQSEKNTRVADSVRLVLRREFPNGLYIQVADNPGVLASKENAASKAYTDVYNLFLEGRFNEAVREKQKADSLFGNRYWTPQLLFIESIYYVQEKQDSVAISKLTQLANNFKTSPISERAATMIDVLRRRAEIESYLTNLQIERKEDAVTKPVDLNSTAVTQAPKKDVTAPVIIQQKPEVKRDSVIAAPIITSKKFVFNPGAAHYVTVILDKVAPAFVNEAKNAFNRYNQQNFYNQRITISNIPLDDRYTLVLLSGFNNAGEAVAYAEKTKPLASSRIVPWLAADKIKFTVIDAQNLQLLLENKDLEGYRKLIEQVLPGKF